MSETTDPPGPPGLPILGSAPEMISDAVAFATRMAHEYGPIGFARVGPRRLWFVSDPELIEQVLVARHRDMQKDEVTRRLSELLGQGLVTSGGDLWKRQRKLAAPALQRTHIAAYAETMVECARDYADGLSAGDARDLHADMTAVTLRIVVRTLFGTDVADEVERVGRSLETCMLYFDDELHSWRLFLPDFIPTPGRMAFRRDRDVLDRIVRSYIEASRTRPLGDDLLSRFIAARDEDGGAMDEQQLRDEVMTMFAAGHETTAIALTSAFDLLSRNPDAAAKLDRELADVLGDRDPSFDDVSDLAWCRAVVNETLRLRPPVWMIGRECLEPTTLGGHRIEPDEAILMPIVGLHRSPRWYEAPMEFRPERWTEEFEQSLPRFAYFPFGGGPRICIGNHFALMEAVLVLATVRRRWRLDVDPSHQIKYQPAITLRPVGRVSTTVRAH